MSGKRQYTIQRYYAVFCSECNEDITEGPTLTKADAEEQQRTHEAWHKRDEAIGLKPADNDTGNRVWW